MAITAAVVGTIVLACSRSVAVESVYPVEHAGKIVRRGFWPRVTGLFKASAANAENVRLRQELAALQTLRGDIRRLEAENARLRNVLGYASRSTERLQPAAVLSRGGGAASVRDSVRVDKGTIAGVRVGDVVVVPEGLVGRVVAVTPHTSEVMLATDPSLKVACEISGDGRKANGILSGGSDELLVARHLRGADGMSAGARVFTSGRGGIFPRGIEIGTFRFHANEVRGATGEVLPRVDYSALEDVFIRCAK